MLKFTDFVFLAEYHDDAGGVGNYLEGIYTQPSGQVVSYVTDGSTVTLKAGSGATAPADSSATTSVISNLASKTGNTGAVTSTGTSVSVTSAVKDTSTAGTATSAAAASASTSKAAGERLIGAGGVAGAIGVIVGIVL